MLNTGNGASAGWHSLRRSMAPFVVMAVVLGGISVFTFIEGYAKDHSGTIGANLMLWALFVGVAYFGSRYRIYWSDDSVRQLASGKATVTIPMANIDRVNHEISIKAGRPFRRLAIYPKNRPEVEFIDVSLKHFNAVDIRLLVRAIRAARPELELPPAWL
jgi:hypothetical protein